MFITSVCFFNNWIYVTSSRSIPRNLFSSKKKLTHYFYMLYLYMGGIKPDNPATWEGVLVYARAMKRVCCSPHVKGQYAVNSPCPIFPCLPVGRFNCQCPIFGNVCGEPYTDRPYVSIIAQGFAVNTDLRLIMITQDERLALIVGHLPVMRFSPIG